MMDVSGSRQMIYPNFYVGLYQNLRRKIRVEDFQKIEPTVEILPASYERREFAQNPGDPGSH